MDESTDENLNSSHITLDSTEYIGGILSLTKGGPVADHSIILPN
jgi:hypothetical protein